MHATYLLRCAAMASAITAIFPATASSQQMSFSYYSDAVVSSDAQTLYTIIDGYDYSSGCTHYDYQNSGHVTGPSGSFQQYFTGLSAYFNVPAHEGSYYFWNEASVNCSCFGSGLGAGGGSGSRTVTHPVPTGEVTLHNAWSGTVPTAYKFRAGLLGGGTYTGRQIREQNGGGDVDTCHWSDSIYPQAQGLSGSGVPWTVEASNQYGDDTVGWLWYVVDYYRANSRAPCQSETSQVMQINRPGSSWVSYHTNRQKMGFTSTTVWSERDGVAVSKSW